jgi:hypothetical protein
MHTIHKDDLRRRGDKTREDDDDVVDLPLWEWEVTRHNRPEFGLAHHKEEPMHKH